MTMLAHVLVIYFLTAQALLLFKLIVSPPIGWATAKPTVPTIVWWVVLHYAIIIWPYVMIMRGIELVKYR